MRRFTSRSIRLALGLFLLSLGVSGCFQTAGASLEPTPTGNAPLIPPSPTIFIQDQQPTPDQGLQPTQAPFEQPTDVPFEQPTQAPFEQPTDVPFEQPTQAPF